MSDLVSFLPPPRDDFERALHARHAAAAKAAQQARNAAAVQHALAWLDDHERHFARPQPAMSVSLDPQWPGRTLSMKDLPDEIVASFTADMHEVVQRLRMSCERYRDQVVAEVAAVDVVPGKTRHG